jgi:hypothetical protein
VWRLPDKKARKNLEKFSDFLERRDLRAMRFFNGRDHASDAFPRFKKRRIVRIPETRKPGWRARLSVFGASAARRAAMA